MLDFAAASGYDGSGLFITALEGRVMGCCPRENREAGVFS